MNFKLLKAFRFPSRLVSLHLFLSFCLSFSLTIAIIFTISFQFEIPFGFSSCSNFFCYCHCSQQFLAFQPFAKHKHKHIQCIFVRIQITFKKEQNKKTSYEHELTHLTTYSIHVFVWLTTYNVYGECQTIPCHTKTFHPHSLRRTH